MTDARKKILDTVDANRDKAVKFLQDIVTIPSVTGDEGKIQAFLSNYLKKLDLEHRRHLERHWRRTLPAAQWPY
jgi:acetylornithine deacetylase